MSAHAQLSPSKRHRWALCPGSIREEAKYPEDRSSPAAIDGTHSHTLLEHCIKAGLADPTSMVGVKMKDDDGEFVIDADRAARVKSAIEYVKSRVAEFNGMAEVIPETRVDPQWFTHRDDLSGTVDIQIIGGGVLEIVDYKDGMGVVSAEENPQLEQYAMGKLAECKLGWNVPEQYPWKEVRMTIIQPKLALKGMKPITTWIAPVKYLLDRLSVLSAQARATDAPDAPLVPGDSQCKFCKAKGSCAALASNVMKEVGIMFQPVVNQSPLDVAQQSADKDPTTMSDDQIRQIMEAAPLMRQLLEATEKEAQRRLEAGTPIPGLKLVNGRGSRAWALPEEEMAEKLVKMGIPKASIYVTKLVSPAQAEKLVWSKRDGTQVQLTDRQLKRMEQEYVVKLAGKLTVAPESDSRPAVITNAAPMFSAISALVALVILKGNRHV
jgi:hypothetical protein